MDGSQRGRVHRALSWLQAQDERKVGLVLLLLAMLGAAVLILWLERGNIYMSDEMGWIDYAAAGSIGDMFKPLNQHLSVLVLLLTRAGLSIWGTSDAYLPFQLVQVAGVLACGGLVYAFARPRVGPLVALAPAMVPMYLGTSSVILLYPLIGLQVLYSIAFGLAAFVALDRRSLRGDIAACVCTVLSLACFSIGIAFLAGVAVAVLLAPDRVRRAYVFLVPLLLYGAWRIWANKYGTTGGPELTNVPAVPFYITDSIATTTTSLFGLSPLIGFGPGSLLFIEGFSFGEATISLVFIAFEVLAIVMIARRLAPTRPLSPMFWGTLAIPLTLWTIQGLVLVAGRTPGETRYIYPGAVAMTLFVVTAVRGVRFSRLAVTTVLGLTVLGIVGNLPHMSYGRDLIEYLAPRSYAYTGLMNLVGPAHADPEYIVSYDTPNAEGAGALSIPVSAYFEISAQSGPLGYPPEKILELGDDIREGADEVIVRMLQLGLVPASSTAARDCTKVPKGTASEGVELPRGGAVLRASAATPVLLRRFAERAHVVVGALRPGQPALLHIPSDRATGRIPWVLETADSVSLTICPIAAAQ